MCFPVLSTSIRLAVILLPQEKAHLQWTQWIEMTRIQIKSMVQILSISLPSRVITTEIRLDWFCNRISTIWAEKGAKRAGLMGISLFGWEHHFGRGCTSTWLSYHSAPSLVLDTIKVPGRVSLWLSVNAYLNYIVHPATTAPSRTRGLLDPFKSTLTTSTFSSTTPGCVLNFPSFATAFSSTFLFHLEAFPSFICLFFVSSFGIFSSNLTCQGLDW
jgi:hypothetical protein